MSNFVREKLNCFITLINKSESAAKGLLFIIIQEHAEKHARRTLSFPEVTHMINNDLRKRLRELQVSNHDEIVNGLMRDVEEYKSIYFMATL